MQKEKGLVSVIIPVYKTGQILAETLRSVLDQDYKNVEILAIDDGSGDDSILVAENMNDPRIKTIRQHNQGMAQTRNNGLKIAKGEYLLFLDHDDLIGPGFLSERINYLQKHEDVGFVGGTVETFPDNPQSFLSAANDIEKEILFFDPRFLTTPSSYVIRAEILDRNNITFNATLSSTADRFMLLQLAKVTKGARVEKGKLFYRISEGGFSQIIKPALIKDNERLYTEMKKNGLIPLEKTNKFKSLYFYMLAGGFRKVGYWKQTFYYLSKSFLIHPIQFIKRIGSKKNLHL